MSFKNLNLECSYTSECNDLVNEFYNPVLSKAKNYDRICGYFNSASLAIAAKGIKNFILNNGKMRLLCGVHLNEDDFNSMTHSSEINEAISDYFLKDIHSMENEIQKNHVKLLAWMLENDFLEIKLGITKFNGNRVGGILHSKNGIIYDDDNNSILFCGSNNETAAGWVNNIENFKVFFSWDSSSKYMAKDVDEFNRFWNNKSDSLEVLDLPEATKRGLIEFAPKSMDELDKLVLSEKEFKNENKDKRELYPHQKEAIDNWFENGKKGIFEMATGTGKTFTTIKALEKLLNEYESNNEPLLVVIAVPTAYLIEQWEKDLSNLNFDKIIKFYSNNSNKKKDLKQMKIRLNTGRYKESAILVTHKSASTDFFVEMLSDCDVDSVFVVDEVHSIGSIQYSNSLQQFYNYRLGLSATPSRWYDEEGDEIINNFFEKIVFSFNLDDAIKNGFLTEYEYHPIFIKLTEEEMEKYLEISQKLAYYFNNSKNKNKINKNFKKTIEGLLFQRQKILNKSKNKYTALKNLIIELSSNVNAADKKLKNLIIFCTDREQLNQVKSILDDLNITKRSFTGEESMKEREKIISDFKGGIIDTILSIKCLDEGVDVPSIETAIILASTSNPREYVQRRGRVLRKFKGKEKAHIYDMIINPTDIKTHYFNSKETAISNIYAKESLRYREFARYATNSFECLKLLDDKFR